MNKFLASKSEQAIELLKKHDLDMWMIVERESESSPDPSMRLVVGGDVVWTSFFIYTSNGKKLALVGNFDVALFENLGHFDEVRGYTLGVREDLIKTLEELNPKTIALNYSIEDHLADGINHGLFLHINEMLKDTVYLDRLVSSEQMLSELRAVKLPDEIECIKTACSHTEKLFEKLIGYVRKGRSGIEIKSFVEMDAKDNDLQISFSPSISIGTKSPQGHDIVTNDTLDKGDIFHIDFGHIKNGFCSDIQRVIYLLRDGESKPPDEVQRAFDTVAGIIEKTAVEAKPGVKGYQIDQIARDILAEKGYPEYQHALGHQVGQFVHDGGTILAPCWERYGRSPYGELQEGNVFTLELEIVIDGVGVVGLEEDIVVTTEGGQFLSKPQRRIVCV
jgi:Xaa-Pro aminopeptidase